jgi:hypothetical protein
MQEILPTFSLVACIQECKIVILLLKWDDKCLFPVLSLACFPVWRTSVPFVVRQFVDMVDHSQGMGMKLTKMHSVLHIPGDVAMFGLEKNWDSGPSESKHKENVKRKATLTSLCKNSLKDQVATRFEESLAIEHAKGIIAGNHEDSSDGHCMLHSHENIGSRMKLAISSTPGSPSYDLIIAAWDGKKGTKFGPECTLPIPQHEALQWLLKLLSNAHNSILEEE